MSKRKIIKFPDLIEKGPDDTWLQAWEFLPKTPRVVLATDGEGVYTAVYDPQMAIGVEESGVLVDAWTDAQTEEPFDSVITHWRECPEPPIC